MSMMVVVLIVLTAPSALPESKNSTLLADTTFSRLRVALVGFRPDKKRGKKKEPFNLWRRKIRIILDDLIQDVDGQKQP